MFNTYSVTQMVATLCEVLGVEKPFQAASSIPMAKDWLTDRLQGRKADRILVYNPDCIGDWHWRKYPEIFIPVVKAAPLAVPVSTVSPSWTPVCFGSMYTGVLPPVHGIRCYTKPVITVDSFFDALPRAGKKAALVAVKDSSMAKIYLNRPIDYFIEDYDTQATEKALSLIREDKYDVICVYNQEYDDLIHRTTPESSYAINAMRNHTQAFDSLTNAVRKYWKGHDSVVVFAPDHGNHYDWDGHGNHGEYREEDININHFYGVFPREDVTR
ncbi:MAG: hypothetical protein ACTTJW_00670 [Sphaerochaeta sp.]